MAEGERVSEERGYENREREGEAYLHEDVTVREVLGEGGSEGSVREETSGLRGGQRHC